MNNSSTRRRRFRVVARPKVRARRVRVFGAVIVVAVLGAVAFETVRKVASDFTLGGLTGGLYGSGVAAPDGAVIVAGFDPLRALAQAAADSLTGTAGDKAEALKRKFPALSDVRVRRNWTEKTATLTLVVRRPVAAVTRRGKAAGFLGDDGTVFAAPEGVFNLSGPSVEVAGASEGELSALAREWPILSADGSFPAPLTMMAYGSSEAGWEANLADGTKVLWGRLNWTREKLSRLSEAVADARSKEPGAFSADLRWFEDGKVLLKPLVAQVGTLR